MKFVIIFKFNEIINTALDFRTTPYIYYAYSGSIVLHSHK